MMSDHSQANEDGVQQEPSDRNELLFRYYEDQWAQLRHHAEQRASVTLQLLAVSVTLGAAYFAASTFEAGTGRWIRVVVSLAIVGLSAVGVLLVRAASRTMELHKLRAREARRRLRFLEEIAKSHPSNFPDINRYFIEIFVIVGLVGFSLLLAALGLWK